MYKIYKRSALLLSAGLLLSGVSACTDKFEEFNTNPHAPTQDQMKGDNAGTISILSSMMPVFIQGQQNSSQMIDQMYGSEYGGMIANINPWSGTNSYTYNAPNNWTSSPFNDILPQIYSQYNQLKELTGGEGLAYQLAQLMRIVGTLRVAECYGPTPYSQVGTSYEGVAYDSESDLYANIISDLETLVEELFLASTSDGSSFAAADFVYGGNIAKWAKYANTLRLRTAMRIVNANATLAQQTAEKAVAHAAGLIETPDEAAWSSYNDGTNPFYRACTDWGDMRVSGNLSCYLNGFNDPRTSKYLTEVNGQYVGARNGYSQTASTFSGYQNNTSQLNLAPLDPLIVMSASESFFHRAEGALRGWNMGGTAQSFYEQGVQVSMNERGASIGSYLSVTSGPSTYTDPTGRSSYNTTLSSVCPQWNASAGFEANLERIIVQKYLANFPNGWETWTDIRRTGYPKFMPIPNNLNSDGVTATRGMRRLPYPMNERNTNLANYNDAVRMLGGPDTGATDLWWAKKN